MSVTTEVTVSLEEATAAVDVILTRTGVPVSEAERERLITFYPIIRGWMERLRMVEARYADPAVVYPAALHD
jgi:hypothetical protein